MDTRMTLKIKTFASVWLLASLMMMASTARAVDFDQVRVTINDIELELEYAQTFEQRSQGLMFRKTLCSTCGMLFKFERDRKASMWMKNTFLPLDVAFIDRNGVITDIKPMEPHDLTSVGSSKAVRYALEMNQGWFAEHDIHVGDQLTVNSQR